MFFGISLWRVLDLRNHCQTNFLKGPPKTYEEMIMFILWLHSFRYMCTSSSRSEETLPNYIFSGTFKKMYGEKTMLILRLNILRYMFTSSSRSAETLPNWILFRDPQQKVWSNYNVNSVTQYFSVYIYVEFQIRGNTAKLYFFRDLQKHIWRNDHLNYATPYFSVYAYVGVQMRGNTANYMFSGTFKKNMKKWPC